MQKTLLFTIDFPPEKGGVAKYYENISSNLLFDKITVLANHETGDEKFDISQKYKIYRKNLISKFPIWPKWIFSFFHLRNVVKKETIKIILVGQILPLGTVAWLYKKIFKTPYAVFIHGMDLGMAQRSKRKSGLAKKILKNAEFIIANSKYTKGLVINAGIDAKNVEVVYPCVETSTRNCAKQNTKRHEVETRPACAGRLIASLRQEKKIILLTIGRLVKRKGQDMVIKALPKVIKKIPELIYIIAGDGHDKKYLESLAKECGVEKNVKFFGAINDEEKYKLYEKCDIFLMPSRNIDGDVEGFGIVYLEAGLYGKSVIAGRSGGISEAVIHGETGFIVDPQNIDEIADAIIKLLVDPDLANKFGVQGRERVLREFNSDKQIEKIKTLLNS